MAERNDNLNTKNNMASNIPRGEQRKLRQPYDTKTEELTLQFSAMGSESISPPPSMVRFDHQENQSTSGILNASAPPFIPMVHSQGSGEEVYVPRNMAHNTSDWAAPQDFQSEVESYEYDTLCDENAWSYIQLVIDQVHQALFEMDYDPAMFDQIASGIVDILDSFFTHDDEAQNLTYYYTQLILTTISIIIEKSLKEDNFRSKGARLCVYLAHNLRPIFQNLEAEPTFSVLLLQRFQQEYLSLTTEGTGSAKSLSFFGLFLADVYVSQFQNIPVEYNLGVVPLSDVLHPDYDDSHTSKEAATVPFSLGMCVIEIICGLCTTVPLNLPIDNSVIKSTLQTLKMSVVFLENDKYLKSVYPVHEALCNAVSSLESVRHAISEPMSCILDSVIQLTNSNWDRQASADYTADNDVSRVVASGTNRPTMNISAEELEFVKNNQISFK